MDKLMMLVRFPYIFIFILFLASITLKGLTMADILDLSPKQRLMINAAATVFIKKQGEFMPHESGQFMVPKEIEKELKQFAIEFKKFPVPEKYIRESLNQLVNAILENMRENGLISV